MTQIHIFIGSKKDFNDFLKDMNVDDSALKFLDLIRQYNELIRASNTGFFDQDSFFTTSHREQVENCIIRSGDYGSVLEHVITNFTQIITAAHDIENLYLHNPPKRVVETVEIEFPSSVNYRYSTYKSIDRKDLTSIYEYMEKEIVGQEHAKKKLISNLYRYSNKKNKKPVVMLFRGPSGIGKTEIAKLLSEYLGGELLRIQFSMMQTEEASNYIFGDKHSKVSFARDLLDRETNLVLIDEFDKVHSNFYNAFYELFDEGKFNDLNYSVDVENCLFILTSNFNSEKEAINKLGMPIFSRLSSVLEFTKLTDGDKESLVGKIFDEIIPTLVDEDKETIEQLKMKNWFVENVKSYENVRLLRARIEESIYETLTNNLLTQKISNNSKEK